MLHAHELSCISHHHIQIPAFHFVKICGRLWSGLSNKATYITYSIIYRLKEIVMEARNAFHEEQKTLPN